MNVENIQKCRNASKALIKPQICTANLISILKFYTSSTTILPAALCLCQIIEDSSVPSPLTSACCLCCPPLLWSPWGWQFSGYRVSIVGCSVGSLYTACGRVQPALMTVLNMFLFCFIMYQLVFIVLTLYCLWPIIDCYDHISHTLTTHPVS